MGFLFCYSAAPFLDLHLLDLNVPLCCFCEGENGKEKENAWKRSRGAQGKEMTVERLTQRETCDGP